MSVPQASPTPAPRVPQLSRPLPGPEVSVVGLTPGTTTAGLPCSKDRTGPTGATASRTFTLVLPPDRTQSSSFSCYFAMATVLYPLLTLGDSGSTTNSYGYLQRANQAYHQADSSAVAKQAVAAHVVV